MGLKQNKSEINKTLLLFGSDDSSIAVTSLCKDYIDTKTLCVAPPLK